MIFQPNSIKWLDCEISSVCNLGCLDCNRWRYNPALDQFQLNAHNQHLNKNVGVDQFRKRLQQFPNLKFVLLQGNVGDPMAHPHIADIVANIFADHPGVRLEINTNGTLGSVSNWKKLTAFADHNVSVIFSIDGLEDTNHIYRRGSDWTKIVENSKTWIDAGGHAEWIMLDFPYNEHQREQAKRQAEEMGFALFTLRARTSSCGKMDDDIIQQSLNPVSKQLLDLTTVDLEKEQSDYQQMIKDLKDQTVNPACLCTEGESYDHYPNFHLNVEGTIWPCAFTSNLPYINNYQRIIWQDISKIYEEKYGIGWNNLDNNPLINILQTDWFAKDLPNSWQQSQPQLMICKHNCGKLRHKKKIIQNNVI